MAILEGEHAIVAPQYKDYIKPMSLRRMTTIMRMSVACAHDCLAQSGIAWETAAEEIEAIVVGTGLGCLVNTEKFLKSVVAVDAGPVSPTPFIQSTHNTVAGQLSILQKNHHYNMTHTQNSLSFELALQDALLGLAEGQKKVLVGAADEHLALLDAVIREMQLREYEGRLTSGAGYFCLGNAPQQGKEAHIAFRDCASFEQIDGDAETVLNNFLNRNELRQTDLDLVIYNGQTPDASLAFDCPQLHSAPYFGYFASASVLAAHLGVDILNNPKSAAHFQMKDRRHVLIYNHQWNNLGLTLLERVPS